MSRPTTAMKTSDKPVTHASFTIERTYPVAPSKVFFAFADKEMKRRWLVEGDGFTVSRYDADFREGGSDAYRFNFQGGPDITNDTQYLDIVRDSRIVFSYKMAVGKDPLSVSLVTVEFTSSGRGTLMTYTEQGAYFDPQDVPRRKEGTEGLLDKLGEVLGV